MRISDDRYSREWLCLEVALRFLRHEARTQTIRVWTGLSDDRIRKLYRSYISNGARCLPRHRGKSPHQVSYFARSLRVQQETAVLASVYCLIGVVPPFAIAGSIAAPGPEPAAALPDVARGELLCQAFEAYQTLIPSSQISFEHAAFLALTLVRGEQLRLGGCPDCGSVVVMERCPVRDKHCHHCSARMPMPAR